MSNKKDRKDTDAGVKNVMFGQLRGPIERMKAAATIDREAPACLEGNKSGLAEFARRAREAGEN